MFQCGNIRRLYRVQIQAADREVQERCALVGLDVRREDARGCLRGASADRARVNQSDRRTAMSQLIGDGAADDARADNHDIHRWYSWLVARDTSFIGSDVHPEPVFLRRGRSNS